MPKMIFEKQFQVSVVKKWEKDTNFLWIPGLKLWTTYYVKLKPCGPSLVELGDIELTKVFNIDQYSKIVVGQTMKLPMFSVDKKSWTIEFHVLVNPAYRAGMMTR